MQSTFKKCRILAAIFLLSSIFIASYPYMCEIYSLYAERSAVFARSMENPQLPSFFSSVAQRLGQKGIIMDNTSKNLYIVSGVCFAIALTSFVFPYAKRAYDHSKSEGIVKETAAAYDKLNSMIAQALKEIESNLHILIEEERSRLYADIDAAKEVSLKADYAITEAKRLLVNEDHISVRKTFEKGYDETVKETPLERLDTQIKKIDKVIGFCKDKRKKRDTAVNDELYMKARLKKPYVKQGFELPPDLSILPESMYAQVPVSTPELSNALAKLPAELNNSMGVNLIKHQPVLEHVRKYGRSENVKAKGKSFYDSAYGSYMQVKSLNDKLPFWYRPDKQDGTMSMSDYKKHLGLQKEVLELIESGDKYLSALDSYLNELHEQYYVYVSEHTHCMTTFRHTRTKYRPATRRVTHRRTDGSSYVTTETYTESYTEHYTTTGYKYYYILTTVTPGRTTTQEIYVGEIDSMWSSWSYAHDEQINYVRKWKSLHHDNSEILHGHNIHPKIESKDCD